MLERVTAEGKAGEEGLNKLAFLVMGVMATLAALFKQGHRCAVCFANGALPYCINGWFYGTVLLLDAVLRCCVCRNLFAFCTRCRVD